MCEFAGELLGTAILIIFGNGVVANVVLNKTKGYASGWIVIAFGWGMAVYVAAFAVSEFWAYRPQPGRDTRLCRGRQVSVGRRAEIHSGSTSRAYLGCCRCFLFYREHFKITSDPGLKSACFFTAPNIRNIPTAFFCEFVGTFFLLLPILLMVDPKFALTLGPDHHDVKLGLGALGSLPVGLLVFAIGLSLGGTTGYAINPARDLMPRLAHFLLPIPYKGTSDWPYAWVPIVGPILGGLTAAAVALIFAKL